MFGGRSKFDSFALATISHLWYNTGDLTLRNNTPLSCYSHIATEPPYLEGVGDSMRSCNVTRTTSYPGGLSWTGPWNELAEREVAELWPCSGHLGLHDVEHSKIQYHCVCPSPGIVCSPPATLLAAGVALIQVGEDGRTTISGETD